MNHRDSLEDQWVPRQSLQHLKHSHRVGRKRDTRTELLYNSEFRVIWLKSEDTIFLTSLDLPKRAAVFLWISEGRCQQASYRSLQHGARFIWNTLNTGINTSHIAVTLPRVLGSYKGVMVKHKKENAIIIFKLTRNLIYHSSIFPTGHREHLWNTLEINCEYCRWKNNSRRFQETRQGKHRTASISPAYMQTRVHCFFVHRHSPSIYFFMYLFLPFLCGNKEPSSDCTVHAPLVRVLK